MFKSINQSARNYTVEQHTLEKVSTVDLFSLKHHYSRRPLSSRLSGAIALLAVVLGGVVGCSPRLKTEDIAAQIYDELSQQGDITVEKVICPSQLQPQVGQVFRCAGVLEQDAIFVITVEQVDENNGIVWEVPNSKGVINLSKLESYFAQAIGQLVGELPTVDCGGEYRINRQGERFDCAVESNVILDKHRIEAIQVKLDSLGNVNWHQVRNLVPEEDLQALDSDDTTAEDSDTPTDQNTVFNDGEILDNSPSSDAAVKDI